MLRPFDEQPIAALASGSGPGAVGVIRLSGKNCWSVVAKSFKSEEPTQERQASLRNFLDPQTGEVIDDLVCTFFKGPKSFTGQDTVELCCHGGPYVIQRILSVLYAQGARPAQAGEFTKRALLNGKLDMTAAEGIRDLVEAQSRQQWLAGRQLYSGKLRDRIDLLRKEVIGAMAYLEAMIDFPDEGDTAHVGLSHVRTRLATVTENLTTLVSTFESGKIASRGLMVAIVGAPNAGKSTLLNNLLGKQRAIVSEVAGTTRDYIEESCLLDGRFIRLVDTAGIRETSDQIEKQGVNLSSQIIDEADIIMLLTASNSTQEERAQIEASLQGISRACSESGGSEQALSKTVIHVLTKSDLSIPEWATQMIPISCKTQSGIEVLKSKLIGIVDSHTGTLEEQPFITSLRQRAALVQAKQSIERFKSQDKLSAGHEMLAFELQEAARSLSSVIGDITNEDILDKVFSEFCIGK